MKERDVNKLLKRCEGIMGTHTDENLVPGWSYERLSAVIGYCQDKGYVEAIDVTGMSSPHKEFIVQRVTAEGIDYLHNYSALALLMKWSKPTAVVLAGIGTLIAALLPDAAKVWLWQKVLSIVHLGQ